MQPIRNLLSILLLSFLGLQCSAGITGVPPEGRATLVGSIQIDSVWTNGAMVVVPGERSLTVVSTPLNEIIRVSRLDTGLRTESTFEVKAPRPFVSLRAFALPQERLLIVGISEVEIMKKRRRGLCDVMLIDLKDKKTIGSQAIDTMIAAGDVHQIYLTAALSPGQTHLLLHQWDYSAERSVRVQGSLFETTTLTVAATYSDTLLVDDESRTLSDPFFLDETTVAILRSEPQDDANPLILETLTDETLSRTLSLPKRMAEEDVAPVSFAMHRRDDGSAIVAVGMEDDDAHTKGLALVRVAALTRDLSLLSTTEFPHHVVSTMLPTKDLQQAIPTNVIEGPDGSIHVLMEEHVTTMLVTRTGSKGQALGTEKLLRHSSTSGWRGQVILSPGAVFISSFSAAPATWRQTVVTNGNDKLSDIYMLAEEWYEHPLRHWHRAIEWEHGTLFTDGDRRRLLYRHGNLLTASEFDAITGNHVESYDIFTLEYSKYFELHNAIWMDDRTIIFSVQSERSEDGFAIYKVTIR